MRPVARIAQSVEQGIENPRVLGSIPSPGTTIPEKPAYGLVFCFWGNGNPDVTPSLADHSAKARFFQARHLILQRVTFFSSASVEAASPELRGTADSDAPCFFSAAIMSAECQSDLIML